jgi:hypothetical protein
MLEDLDQDIHDHIERETQDNIERGMAEEARYAVLRKFGNESAHGYPLRISTEHAASTPKNWASNPSRDDREGCFIAVDARRSRSLSPLAHHPVRIRR